MSTAPVELRYAQNGAPLSVLKPTAASEPKPAAGQVVVRMLAASMNHSDVRAIQGDIPAGKAGVSTSKGKVRYADVANVTFVPDVPAAKLPAVGGSEGVGVVAEVGSGVGGLEAGDRVNVCGTGTWATSIVADAKCVRKVPAGLPNETAATLSAPGTALRLLSDFGDLKAGDVLIQNDAGSAVGQAVIQLAKVRGIKTINVVPQDHDNSFRYLELVTVLKGLGADVVVPEEYLHNSEFDKVLSDMPAPTLGLDGRGGRAGTNVARRLAPGSTMVLYGQEEPVVVPGEKVSDIKFEGFTWAKWCQDAPPAQFEELVSQLAPQLSKGELVTWLERHDFTKFPAACQIAADTASLRDAVLVIDSDACDDKLLEWYMDWAGPTNGEQGRF